jgi:hypothetical protein
MPDGRVEPLVMTSGAGMILIDTTPATFAPAVSETSAPNE